MLYELHSNAANKVYAEVRKRPGITMFLSDFPAQYSKGTAVGPARWTLRNLHASLKQKKDGRYEKLACFLR